MDKLNAAMVATLNEPAIRERLALQGLEPTPSSPEEFSAFRRAELAKWDEPTWLHLDLLKGVEAARDLLGQSAQDQR